MIEGKSVLAVVPARGGSKGLARKNTRLCAGKPLVAWSIEAATEARHVDRVILSSEDPEIIETARSRGCEVPFVRPLELAADTSSMVDVVLHALATLGTSYDYVVLLQPTSPLRVARDVDGCLEAAHLAASPSAVSVAEPAKSPYWMYTRDAVGLLSPLFPTEARANRRQDLPTVYALNGAVYAVSTVWFARTKAFVTSETVGYVMPPERSVDVDSALDFALCEALLVARSTSGTGATATR
jgi:CMP-N,N'-diacetyllegionaminic acid synthase